ncbi:MAG: hypothetical protein EOO06_20465 [Chitinophagaceae bacterium]|nr:MAG: hypothetical protein EOO06_20465 [Chitinophagaceae bacterium]
MNSITGRVKRFFRMPDSAKVLDNLTGRYKMKYMFIQTTGNHSGRVLNTPRDKVGEAGGKPFHE